MSDILKVTTPVPTKNQVILPKQGIEASNPFNAQETLKVVQTHNQSELTKQHSGPLDGGDAPALLLNLMKDPAVAVSYLKNIFMLEEMYRLLPANNTTVTPEIEQVFQKLIMQSEEIVPEMIRQETDSTMFKGAIYDFLRQTGGAFQGRPEVQIAIANLLKSMNNIFSKIDILDAVANSLDFLKNSLSSSKTLSTKLETLISKFRSPDAGNQFPTLKGDTVALLKEIEGSIMFSQKLSKVVSITTYNLSRYNDSMEFFRESAFRLRQFLGGEQRKTYNTLIEKFLVDLKSGVPPRDWPKMGEATIENSRVMDALIKLVSHQATEESNNPSESAKIDKILHSLLSSPSNFTPLLHFIIPVMHEQLQAFAEIWIDPESNQSDLPEGEGPGMHFLLVIDVEGAGRFEAELLVRGQTIDFSLFCPPGQETNYEDMMKRLPKTLAGMSFHLGQVRLAALERPRSLMDVFKSLPYKRVGVDVKI